MIKKWQKNQFVIVSRLGKGKRNVPAIWHILFSLFGVNSKGGLHSSPLSYRPLCVLYSVAHWDCTRLYPPLAAAGFVPPSWQEESKETGGFVAGNPTGTASPWHTTLLAKYSVLYLHPRLTWKRSVSTMERSFCSAGKRACFCEWERTKTGPVSRVGAGI